MQTLQGGSTICREAWGGQMLPHQKVQRMATQQDMRGIGSHVQTPTHILFGHGWVLRAVHRRKAAVAATTATAWQSVTNDGARAQMVKIGLRYGTGKQTKIKQLTLNWLALNMLPPTNIKLSPLTSKIHWVHLNNLPMTIGSWRHETARRNNPPKNMCPPHPLAPGTTGKRFLRTKHHTGWKRNH